MLYGLPWSKYRFVNRRLPFAKLLAVLCLIALLGAQVFGSGRGYVCDCAGVVEWTALDHCDGPHGTECHRETSAKDANGAHQDSDGARKDHEQLRDEVQVRLLPVIQAPMHVPVLLAVMELLVPAMSSVDFTIGSAVVVEDLGPPPGVTVARTVVLLV